MEGNVRRNVLGGGECPEECPGSGGNCPEECPRWEGNVRRNMSEGVNIEDSFVKAIFVR